MLNGHVLQKGIRFLAHRWRALVATEFKKCHQIAHVVARAHMGAHFLPCLVHSPLIAHTAQVFSCVRAEWRHNKRAGAP